MGIVIRKARHQQDGERVKSTTMPIELQKGTVEEQLDNSFEAYTYSGYHKTTIADYLQGSKGSPYSRRYSLDGKLLSCGINWYEDSVQRLDMMLRATGEPVTLWRRKWTGERCPECTNDRVNVGDSRCPICFGTGFVGGFVEFINTREANGRIYMRVGSTEEKLTLETNGLHQAFAPGCWTLPVPTVRDWDIVVRYDSDTGEETWRYEVMSVTRNKGFFNVPTVQNFSLIRLDKTDPRYKLRWVDLADNLVGQLAGDHDSGDLLQTQIEKRFGDGAGDQGFSDGYKVGFLNGFDDGKQNEDYQPYFNHRTQTKVVPPVGLPNIDSWFLGLQTGYRDGFAQGQEAARKDGYYVWTPPRDPGVTIQGQITGEPTTRDYDEIERHPEIWKP